MGTYVLLSGAHQGKDGVVHEAGDVVESESNLAERDPARFVEWTDSDEAGLHQQQEGDQQ